MLKRFLVVGVCLTVASTAFAGATVDLVTVDTYGGTPIAAPNPDGTWNGGEVFVVEAMVTTSQSFNVRGMQIDYRASSPELILGQDIDNVNNGIDGIPNFAFNYSLITFGQYPANGNVEPFPSFIVSTTGNYKDFSNLLSGDPLVTFPAASVFNGTAGIGQIPVTAGTPWLMGGMLVGLPTAPGSYTLDLLKPINLAGEVDLEDENFGMVIDFGFGMVPSDPVRKWGSAVDSPDIQDTIVYSGARGTGGPLTFRVIPEPATLVLLGLGGLAAARRRRP